MNYCQSFLLEFETMVSLQTITLRPSQYHRYKVGSPLKLYLKFGLFRIKIVFHICTFSLLSSTIQF